MNKFDSFLNFLKNEFKKNNFYVLDIDPITLNHLVGLKTKSDALFFKFKNKGILIYIRESECVVLGSIVGEDNRKFKQLLILTAGTEDNSLLDNTNSKIDKNSVRESLESWLVENIA